MLAPIGALDTQLALSGKRITPELVLGLGFTHKMHVPSALGRARGSLKVARSTDGRDGEGRGGGEEDETVMWPLTGQGEIHMSGNGLS